MKTTMNYLYINLTLHVIRVEGRDGLIEILPSGRVARVVYPEFKVGVDELGIPLYSRNTIGVVEGIPEHEFPWRRYIVSAAVREAMRDRRDLVSPYGLKRDSEGNVTSCTGFYCN